MLHEIDRREQVKAQARWRARHALLIDMMKTYASPLLLAAFVNPLLGSGPFRFGPANYVLVVFGLAMALGALIFVPARRD